MSPFHFCRAFKQAFGETPHRYVIQRRLDRAAALLRGSDLSIAQIAYKVGMSSQAHLTTLFRKHRGTTPRAFRDSG